MKRVMIDAEVGDDVYGEDPSARALELRVADLLGKEAAVFVSSGTMGNQLAILASTSRGDEVYTGSGSHCVWYESGAAGAWSGVQLVEVGAGGLFTAAELAAALKPRAYYCPNPRLVVVENTHNRGGGRVFPQDEIERIAETARTNGLSVHLDGARLWNASVATSKPERELAAPFDTVTVCFSKGLGAPVGSVLAGTAETILKARRLRKMLGGGMRQIGMLAAACLYALDNHRASLATDHANAKRFAARVAQGRGVQCEEPETNIVMIDLDREVAGIVARLAEEGVHTSAFGPRRIRAVFHLDVSASDADVAADRLLSALREVGAR